MNSNLKEVFLYFFRMGFVAFGGPAAHVAMMEEDLVQNRKWMSTETFLDYLGATNLIPGPNSTEMTMHCGYDRAGVAGLFVAGASFVFPAVLLTLLVAMAFEKYAEISWVVPIVNGIKAAVISFIIAAIYKLGKKAAKSKFLALVGVIVLIVSYLGVNEVICILAAGLLVMTYKFLFTKNQLKSVVLFPIFAFLTSYSNLKIFLIFFKVGSVLFGSGYVLFAYLDGELIENLGWLSHPDLVEAVAVGQVTPGPILSTATFIGYKLGGVSGACLATLGMFLPSFLFVWILNPLISKMKQSAMLSNFLQAVNVAAVAVMLTVTWKMAQSIIIDWRTAMICAISFFIYFYFKGINTLWIILGGAVLGFLFNLV